MTKANAFSLLLLWGLLLSAPMALAQAGPQGDAPQGAPQEDQVAQLAEALDLDEDQQSDIRALVDEMGSQIEELQAEAQELQQSLSAQVGHDYDEGEIRENAARLGELTGEMTALSALLQSKVQAIFTPEQREELERQAERQREMQQQMMQERMQQQQQQQQQGAPQGQSPQGGGGGGGSPQGPNW